MSKFRDQKVEKVSYITDKLKSAKSFLLIDYKGITVEQDTQLRCEFRDANIHYEVLKNRLVKIALNNMGINDFDEALKGPTAIAMSSSEDVAAPARIAVKKAKDYKKMAIKCGLFDGKFYDESKCRDIASIPAKEVLLSQLLGMLQAPIASFTRVIDAIANK